MEHTDKDSPASIWRRYSHDGSMPSRLEFTRGISFPIHHPSHVQRVNSNRAERLPRGGRFTIHVYHSSFLSRQLNPARVSRFLSTCRHGSYIILRPCSISRRRRRDYSISIRRGVLQTLLVDLSRFLFGALGSGLPSWDVCAGHVSGGRDAVETDLPSRSGLSSVQFWARLLSEPALVEDRVRWKRWRNKIVLVAGSDEGEERLMALVGWNANASEDMWRENQYCRNISHAISLRCRGVRIESRQTCMRWTKRQDGNQCW
jgi:hypothetical protein